MGSQCQGGSARQRASRVAGAGSGLGPRAAGLGRVSRGAGGGRGRTCRVGPVGQREQRKSDRGCCGALLSTRAGGVPDGRARLVSEVKRALRMVLGRPRGLGRAVHWAERERSGLGRAGLEGLGWPAWELGRSAGLRGERGKEELGWVA